MTEEPTPQLTESVVEDFFKKDEELMARLPAVKERYELEKRNSPNGVRTKLTPERYEAIIKYIKAGCAPLHAAAAVGVTEQTVRGWVQEGLERPDSIFGLFVEDLQRAKAVSINRNVMIVQRAAQDNWVAAKWLLQVSDPDLYGNKSTVRQEITSTTTKTEVKQIVLGDEELKKVLMIEEMIESQNKIDPVKEKDNTVDVEYRMISEEPEEENAPEPPVIIEPEKKPKKNTLEIEDVIEIPELEQ